MDAITHIFLRFCPRSGRFVGFKAPKGFASVLAPIVGLVALGWVIFRVATKPSRIAYPCVRASMPLASSFIGYVLFFGVSLGAWTKARKQRTVLATISAAALTVAGYLVSNTIASDPAGAVETQLPTNHLAASQPIGTAVGIYPGRVVWVHRSDATRDDCSPASVGHEWFRPESYDQSVIDAMVSAAIRRLSGTTTDPAAWAAVFRFHNTTRGKGAVGYVPGEKVFIKTNATSSWSGQFSTSDLSYSARASFYAVSETSPGIILAVLRQLVNVVGVAQTDIYVGDPLKHVYKHCYDIWHGEFPGVHYLDTDGYADLGREKAAKSTTAVIKYSDRGTVLKSSGTTGTAVTTDSLYAIYEQAEYLLNIPMLKGHKRAGVTMFAKNHFGSHARSSATHLHGGLVAPNEYPNTPYRQDYGIYRVQVDLMGHHQLGRKNLFYLMDALWATDYELDIPVKWEMAPFSGDWMSSVFVSFDPVAIESVGYDFLRSEFTAARGAGTYVQMNAVDDYLHQAADATNWPAGISYDPEGDGTTIGSLGTHEHWNDGLHMQYSRDLGTGNGIELMRGDAVTSVADDRPAVPNQTVLYQNHPNPFNPETRIGYRVSSLSSAWVRLAVYDLLGQEVAVLVNERKGPGDYEVKFNGSNLAGGVYIYKMTTADVDQARKLLLLR